MTTYELRPPRADRALVSFDDEARARAYRAAHFQRAKVMLRLFEVRRDEREVLA